MLKKLTLSIVIGAASLGLVACGDSGPTKVAECNDFYNFAIKNAEALGTDKAEIEKTFAEINDAINKSEAQEKQMQLACTMMLEASKQHIGK